MMPKTRRNAGRYTTAARTLIAFAVLLTGCSPPGDDSEVSRALRSSAEQGDAEAQFDLGLMYALGDGVAQDDAEAVRWYRLAAEQGHAPAQYSLGAMYAMGEGVTQDYVLAHTWCTRPARRRIAPGSPDQPPAVRPQTQHGRLSPCHSARVHHLGGLSVPLRRVPVNARHGACMQAGETAPRAYHPQRQGPMLKWPAETNYCNREGESWIRWNPDPVWRYAWR